MPDTTVSLVIPARNEAANLPWVLERVPDCVDEIVLVDGHSVDDTIDVARRMRPDIRVVEQRGRGKGDALREGFLAARGDLVVMIDADGSMSPAEIPRFVYLLEHGYDFVKGSRFVPGGGSEDITLLRRMGNLALLGLFNRLYTSPFTDLCYGYIGFHRRHLSRLDLTRPGFEVEAQLIISALRSRLRVAEAPSLETPRRFGESNLRTFRDGTRVLRTVVGGHEVGLSGVAVQHLRCRVLHRAPRTPEPILVEAVRVEPVLIG